MERAWPTVVKSQILNLNDWGMFYPQSALFQRTLKKHCNTDAAKYIKRKLRWDKCCDDKETGEPDPQPVLQEAPQLAHQEAKSDKFNQARLHSLKTTHVFQLLECAENSWHIHKWTERSKFRACNFSDLTGKRKLIAVHRNRIPLQNCDHNKLSTKGTHGRWNKMIKGILL